MGMQFTSTLVVSTALVAMPSFTVRLKVYWPQVPGVNMGLVAPLLDRVTAAGPAVLIHWNARGSKFGSLLALPSRVTRIVGLSMD